jgi:hypothetical protein
VRVPVYEEQHAQSQAVGLPVDEVRPPNDAGLQQGLASLDRAGAAIYGKVREAEEKAIAAEVTDSETNFTKRATGEIHGDSATGKTGFMSLLGRSAEADGAPVMERIEKHRQDIANGLTNAEAKKLFLARTGKQVEGYRASVETHVSQERTRADLGTLKAREDSALDAMFNAARQGDGATVQNQSLALESSIRALALSPQDAERDVALWRRQTIATQLDAFLDVKRVDAAESLFKDAREQLGPQLSAKYEEAIKLKKGTLEGDALALSLVNDARQENGFIDTGKAIESLAMLPEDKRTPQVEQAFSKWMALEATKQKAVTEQYFNRGLSAYLQRHDLGDVAPLDHLWLKNPKNDPEGWLRLEQIAKSHREGGQTAAQSRAMTEFLVDVADHPEKYATMKLEEFNHTWLPRLSRNDSERAGVVLAQQHANAGKPEKLAPLEVSMLLQKGREAGVFDPKQRDVSKWSEDQAANFYAAQEILSQRIAQTKRATGQAPDLKTIEGWVNELMISGKDPQRGFMGFFGGTTRLEAEVQGTGFEPKWTDEQKQKATDYLKKIGARIDDPAIDTVLRKVYGLPALPQQAVPAKSPTEIDPGRWGLDLTPEPPPSRNEDKEPSGPGRY